MRRLKFLTFFSLITSIGYLIPSSSHADLPSVKLITAPLVAPSDAWNAYGSNQTHTTGVAALAVTAPEIKALARTLGAGRLPNDDFAKNAFLYIRNNIDTEFRFGLGKGARGALIDQSGTPFDQAELMVKLLSEAGINASYQVGTIGLTAAQFGHWTGVVRDLQSYSGNNTYTTPQTFNVDLKSACQFLADGGIPALVNGASTCSGLSGSIPSSNTTAYFTVGHVWVLANGKTYDPSFKMYDLYASRGDIASLMGCGTASSCASQATDSVMSAVTTSTFAGANTLSGTLNGTNALQQQMANLETGLKQIDRSLPIYQVVGGKILRGSNALLPGTNLPYPSAVSTSQSWAGAVPDKFRTVLTVRVTSSGRNKLFADEMSGRRLIYTGGGDGTSVGGSLSIDGQAISYECDTSCAAPVGQFILSLNYPYVANGGAYGDAETTINMVEPRRYKTGYFNEDGASSTIHESSILGSMPVTLVFGLGGASASTQQQMSKLAEADRLPLSNGRPSTNLSLFNRWEDLNTKFGPIGTYRYYQALLTPVVSGVTGTSVNRHHDMGIIYSSRASGLTHASIQSELSATAFVSENTSAASTAFEIEAITQSEIEAISSVDPTDGADIKSVMDSLASGAATGFIDGTSSTSVRTNYASALVEVTSPSQMTSVINSLASTTEPFELRRRQALQAAANAGYTVIMTKYGEGSIFLKPGDVAYTLWENLKGAGGNVDPLSSVMKSATVSDLASARKKYLSVSNADGELLYTSGPDIVSGAGDFPYSLPFIRTYQGGSSYTSDHYATGYHLPEVQSGSTESYTVSTYRGPDEEVRLGFGGGWTHNYNVSLTLSGDPSRTLGSQNAVEAAPTIATSVILSALASNPTLLNRARMISVMRSFAYNFFGNVAILKKGIGSTAFYKLIDGTFSSTTEPSSTLVQSGALMATRNSNKNHDRLGKRQIYKDLTFNYTSASGEQIYFDWSLKSNVDFYRDAALGYFPQVFAPVYKANYWTFPNGVRLDFEYQQRAYQSTTPDSFPFYDEYGTPYATPPVAYDYAYVLTGVRNNLGRRLNINSTWGGGSSLRDTISSVSDENSRSVSYAYNNSTFSVTGTDGKVTRYEYAPDAYSPEPSQIVRPKLRLRRIFTPGNTASPLQSIAYDELFRVKEIKDRNGNITKYYSGGVFGSDKWKFSTLLTPLGNLSTSLYDNKNSVLSSTDPLGRVTTNYYDNAGRPIKTVLPDNNGVQNFYDVRGNTIGIRKFSKSCGPNPTTCADDTNTSTSYVEGAAVLNCANLVVCNKPASETDARGKVTDYTWNGTTGDLTKVLSPAVLSAGDGANIRPQTDLTYTVLGGISFLNSKVQKINSNQSNTTTYGYDSANHYMLKTATDDSNGLALTTTVNFDAVGNLTSVDGPRTDVDDVTTYKWDANRRLILTVSPDPDGNGSLKRQVVRHYYDDDGQEERTETGTGNDADGGGFVAKTYEKRTFDGVGNVIRTEKGSID